MSAIELRERLIEKIRKTTDENILEEAYRLLSLESNDTDIYKLTNGQKAEIESSKSDIKLGQFLTNDQANKEMDEWLNK